MTTKKQKALYRKRLRDSQRVEELKPLIDKAHKILRHTKIKKNKEWIYAD